MPLTSPHTPLSVNEAWRGKSGLNAYADLVMETDAVVGRVLKAIAACGVDGNTLVVLTSDNGCAPYVGAADLEARGHFPSGPLRGYKADVWEGGHRVPFVVRWPRVVRPGVSASSSCSKPTSWPPVRKSWEPSCRTTRAKTASACCRCGRGATSQFAKPPSTVPPTACPRFRKGPWKLVFGTGSGGWSKERDEQPVQLYNLAADLGETKNVCREKPEVVAELTALMERIVNQGRSTSGASQNNDVAVDWRRFMSSEDQPKKPAKRKAKKL